MKTPIPLIVFSRCLNKVILRFDISASAKKMWLNIVSFVFFLAVAVVCVQFIRTAVTKAELRAFWGDETYGLAVAREQGSGHHIVRGVRGQGSPAPLDYIVLKAMSDIHETINVADLPFNVYYRLHTISYSLLAGVFVVVLMHGRLRRRPTNYIVLACQLLLLLSALIFFYFWPFNLQYSVETRPYSLWNALWFCTLVMYIYYSRLAWPMIIVMVFMAATATASIYQLFSLGCAWLVVQIWEHESWRNIVINALKYYTLPTFVALYYIFIRPMQFAFTPEAMGQDYYQEFFRFWTTKEMVPLLSVSGILLTAWFKKLRPCTLVFMTMLLLYLMSPLLNYIAIQHGFFFSSRQYIYYDLVYPLFLISLMWAIPIYVEKIRGASGVSDRSRKIGGSSFPCEKNVTFKRQNRPKFRS